MTDHEVLVNNKPHNVRILEKNGNVFVIEINGKSVKTRLTAVKGRTFSMEINGQTFTADAERTSGDSLKIVSGKRIFDVQFQPKSSSQRNIPKAEPPLLVTRKPVKELSIEKGAITAPIAGRIVLINVSLGKKVERGECVCILEAMKMENEVVAPETGVVKEVRVSKGAVVNKGDVLVVVS